MFSKHYRFPSGAETSVVVGCELLAVALARLTERPTQGVFVLADPAVGSKAETWARALGAVACWTLPGGEAVKRVEVWSGLAERLSAAGAERGALIVAIGGGSLCDLAGFLAATYRRGIRLWLVPTTSLAMCDAALGGKNGLDLGALKNAVGTIRQPESVFCDLDFLRTLPASGRRGGLAELAKMAAVLDAEAFVWLERHAAALAQGEQSTWQSAVELAIRLKLEVVIADEFERDRRRWLNFGHTLGHALESASAWSLAHGDAVALGMLAECRAAESPVTTRLRQLLLALGLPSEPASPPDLERLWALAQQDKKTQAGQVLAVVPESIGSGRLVVLERPSLERAFPCG
jgi:3-dehydroquinate synthetase